MECPFSTERLRDLVCLERFTPAQLATLAQAATGETTDVSEIEAWLRAAGIALPGAPQSRAPTGVKPDRKHSPRPRKPARPEAGTRTQPCGACGKPVTRKIYDAPGAEMFCNRACHVEWQHTQKSIRRTVKRSRALAPAATKRCYACKQVLPLADFCRDKNRADGHANCCRACSQQKSARYYLEHQAELKERARERKRKKRAG